LILSFDFSALSQIDKIRDQLDDASAEEQGLRTLGFLMPKPVIRSRNLPSIIQDFKTMSMDLLGLFLTGTKSLLTWMLISKKRAIAASHTGK